MTVDPPQPSLKAVMEQTVTEGWKKVLLEFDRELEQAAVVVQKDLDIGIPICPPVDKIFRAFSFFDPQDVRVVILGQDPYYTPDVADGLCFSVSDGNPVPPSLCNIFKEIESTCSTCNTHDGDLTRWAEQGVLLLNSSLTTRVGFPAFHQKHWKSFTDRVIAWINDNLQDVVFLLWGNYARSKASLIDSTKHHKLSAGHPSPLSVRYFAGCDHFRRCNELLTSMGKKEIEW